MIGGVLSGRDGARPTYHESSLAAVIDCANVIAIHEKFKSSDYRGKQQWMISMEYLVSEICTFGRSIQLPSKFVTIYDKGDRKLVTPQLIKSHYEQLMGRPITEAMMFENRIVVTENVQVQAYEILLQSMMSPENNINAIDVWYKFDNRTGSYEAVPSSSISVATRISFEERMKKEHHLESVVNMVNGAVRCISVRGCE